MPKQNDSNRPAHTVRYGNIKAAIWKNQTRNGAMFNVTLVRSYKDGEEWKDSSSFGYDDLLTLSKAVDEAHSFIHGELSRKSEQSQDQEVRQRKS